MTPVFSNLLKSFPKVLEAAIRLLKSHAIHCRSIVTVFLGSCSAHIIEKHKKWGWRRVVFEKVYGMNVSNISDFIEITRQGFVHSNSGNSNISDTRFPFKKTGHLCWGNSKWSGQISIIPKPESFGDFGEVPLLNHHLGWLLGGKRRYNLPRSSEILYTP